jgi:hypothetical protein
MNQALPVAWAVGGLIYGAAQILAAFAGIEHHWGPVWGVALIALSLFLRFPLPITFGAFFGAKDVWDWHWAFAAFFAAPGLLFIVPGVIAGVLASIRNLVAPAGSSKEINETFDSKSSDRLLEVGSQGPTIPATDSSGRRVLGWVGVAVVTGVVGLFLGLSIGQQRSNTGVQAGQDQDEWEIVEVQPSANSRPSSAAGIPVVEEETQTVDPIVARARAEALASQPIELGALVRLFLLSEDEHADWLIGASASSPVRWATDGIDSVAAQISSQRIGYARVVVDGKHKTAIRQQVEELAWEVMLGSEMPPKFGPQFVWIQPDMDCFGSTGSGCDFELDATLRSAGVDFRRLCINAPYGNGSDVYLVSADGSKPAWLEYITSTGSGGTSNWVALFWNEDDFSDGVKECLRNQSSEPAATPPGDSQSVREVDSRTVTGNAGDPVSAPPPFVVVPSTSDAESDPDG